MVLEQEKIVSNTKKYFDSLSKLGIETEKLITYLGDDLIKSSAYATNNMPNVFEGGLIDFSLNVTKNLVSLNGILPDDKKIEKNTLVKVGLLFSIGKAKLYIPNKSEWHVKNQGQVYTYDESLVSMRIGQRSLYYCLINGIHLTEEEAQAIVYHDIDDDKMVKGYSSNLSRLLKMAIELTVIEKK